MFRYLGRLLKAALVSVLGVGGGVGLLIFIFVLVTKGDQHAALYALKGGIVIGLCFSVLLMTVMILFDFTARLFLAGGAQPQGMWELEQTRELIAQGSLKEVTQACRKALLVIPNVTNVRDDMENLMAHASTGSSVRSSGEEIELEINPVQEDRWHLCLSSRCRNKNVVFDYGKNFENVEAWLKCMRRELNVIDKS